MEYFERAQRLAVSRPAWTDEDGHERRGKTVVLDIRALKESPGAVKLMQDIAATLD